MDGASDQRVFRRRSARIVRRLPLFVSPTGAPATAEWEPVATLVISMHGGLIRSRQDFPVGTMLDIRMQNNQRFTRGRVVWTAAGDREFVFEVGFEILEPPGFWEFNFTEDRWSGKERAAYSPS